MHPRLTTLIEELTLVFDGNPWYGHGVLEKLSAISSVQAETKVSTTDRSICQIVAHMIAWRRYAILKGSTSPEYRVEIDGPIDWPDLDQTNGWSATLRALKESQVELLEVLNTKEDNWLNTQVPGTKYNFDFLIQGITHHDIYHLGQIGLVLRMVREQL